MKNNNLPKDVFLHLLNILALYISFVGLITLLFQYINLGFPDPLAPVRYSQVAWPIRWSMASLIIVFPVFLFSSWLLYKDYVKNPEKRELKIRKWLVYFTLFVASIIIITDLISLVYNFLGGDLTARFTSKIFVILLAAGAVFGYYFMDLKEKLGAPQIRMWAWTTSVIVFISVLAGFFTAGSPLKARLFNFDERKVSDLQTIQNETLSFWVQKDRLPESLEELTNEFTGFTPPRDPQEGMSYTYRIVSRNETAPTFELCATFNLSSDGAMRAVSPAPRIADPYVQYYDYSQSWTHDAGEVCFERTIDPELYRRQREELKF